MPESGGPTTQSGINYQNQVAALYLGRLIDPRQRPKNETVTEVRVEAPAHVDDIVVRFADGHWEFLQVNEKIRLSGKAWQKLWADFEQQRWHEEFGDQDRLLLVLGSRHAWSDDLRDDIFSALNTKPTLLQRKPIYQRIVIAIKDIIHTFDDGMGDL